MIALAVGRSDQPDVMRLAVLFQFYHPLILCDGAFVQTQSDYRRGQSSMAVHRRELTLPNILSLLSSDAVSFQVGVLQLSFVERFFLLILAYVYHSYPNGLKPSASNFSTSPGVGGGGGGVGSVRITCSSSLSIAVANFSLFTLHYYL